ncbi:hypothetical protein IAU59_007197 [Kwoniella sp. CBS 9459]
MAGITREGHMVADLEAKRAKEAGAAVGLLYPSHGWPRSGYQKGAAQARCKEAYEASEIPLILFQHDDATNFLVGHGNIASEALLELIVAGKAHNYPRVWAIHDKLLSVTKAVYHGGSYMEAIQSAQLLRVA